MESLATMERPSLENVIQKAMQKMGVSKEYDLCRYLPIEGKRIHHFSFGKMKIASPIELVSLLKKHILESESPVVVPTKERAPKTSGSRSAVNLKLNRLHAKELLSLARSSGNQELIDLLAPVISLKDIQKELIQSIKEKKLDRALWKSYEEALTASSDE